jgi:hypothetical protein
MDSSRSTARIVGVLFLVALITSLVGGLWLESIITAEDYLSSVSANETQVALAVLLELINGIAVVGIAVCLFPIFRQQNEALALGYVAFRIIEAVIIIAAVVSPLALVSLSQEYLAASASEAIRFDALGSSLLAMRNIWAGQLLGIFFCVAALLLYYLLFRTKLVPRWLSGWGFVAVALVLAWNVLELIGIHIGVGIILALPMILNEIVLAVWLIVKGFSAEKASLD